MQKYYRSPSDCEYVYFSEVVTFVIKSTQKSSTRVYFEEKTNAVIIIILDIFTPALFTYSYNLRFERLK